MLRSFQTLTTTSGLYTLPWLPNVRTSTTLITHCCPIARSVEYATILPEKENAQVRTADLVSIRSIIFPITKSIGYKSRSVQQYLNSYGYTSGYIFHLPVHTSHSRIVLSAAPDRKFFVSQSTSIHHTAPP